MAAMTYSDGLAQGWEDCRKDLRIILASEIPDAEKLALIEQQAAMGAPVDGS